MSLALHAVASALLTGGVLQTSGSGTLAAGLYVACYWHFFYGRAAR